MMLHYSGAFAFTFGLIVAAPPQSHTRIELDAIYDAQNSEIEAGLVELKRIEGDMTDMRMHIPELENNSRFRHQQIRSIRLRHPAISVSDTANPQAIYTALFNLRQGVRERLRPLLASTRRYDHRQRCTGIRETERLRARIEDEPDYLRQSLAERADWNALYDALTSKTGTDGPCKPEDYLPTEPVTEASLARTERRYAEAQARTKRIQEITRRPAEGR